MKNKPDAWISLSNPTLFIRIHRKIIAIHSDRMSMPFGTKAHDFYSHLSFFDTTLEIYVNNTSYYLHYINE